MCKSVIPVIVTTYEALESAVEENVKMIYIDPCITQQVDTIVNQSGYVFLSQTQRGGVFICRLGEENVKPLDLFGIL